MRQPRRRGLEDAPPLALGGPRANHSPGLGDASRSWGGGRCDGGLDVPQDLGLFEAERGGELENYAEVSDCAFEPGEPFGHVRVVTAGSGCEILVLGRSVLHRVGPPAGLDQGSGGRYQRLPGPFWLGGGGEGLFDPRLLDELFGERIPVAVVEGHGQPRAKLGVREVPAAGGASGAVKHPDVPAVAVVGLEPLDVFERRRPVHEATAICSYPISTSVHACRWSCCSRSTLWPMPIGRVRESPLATRSSVMCALRVAFRSPVPGPRWVRPRQKCQPG